jgi:hypothetical protein
MGFFSSQRSSTGDWIKAFLRKAGIKLLIVTAGWLALYFGTQLIKEGPAMLLNLLVGSVAGLAIGWSMAEDAVQDSGLTGPTLWGVLILLGGLPIVVVEGGMYLITHWSMEFGRWMCMGSAIIMMFASTIWRASADE